MSQPAERKPHAVLDLASRALKARKIERLLGLEVSAASTPLRLLEIGTGSGGIAHWFAMRAGGRYAVDAVDVSDQRLVGDGYRFQRVDGTRLPFADACFDVVLSNHVIEHVGDDAAQAEHLREMRRVLAHGGVAYLAVPNRWMLVEPHYRLAFLSWWPEHWRSAWLRLWGKGRYYDCRPFSKPALEALLRATGWQATHLNREAVAATFEIEAPQSSLWRVLRRLPSPVWRLLAPIVPTLIYRMQRSSDNRHRPLSRRLASK